ncbi:hypothetical protein BJ508DRAFT_240538 [Ascobolus immersus RN42]|uniref:ferric-chelate reductase (NADPH) n=1 Tax=Ascobolus immersus RN42 TaxID=1160509 RepID=A0A3N4I0F2_ASCIM|nr:hypothetical protein BJ508DRAFT_240538 [Ascobolus immersus RN42]
MPEIPTPTHFSSSGGYLINPHLYDINNLTVLTQQRLDPWPWSRGWVHAMGVAIFLAGWIFIFSLFHLHDIYVDSRRLRTSLANNTKHHRIRGSVDNRTVYDRLATHLRQFTYLRSKKWRLASVSLGSALLVIAGFGYPMLYIFTQFPYYRLHYWWGPPGISGRAGMMGVATVPFIVALGMKANLVSVVTGVGHERLNMFHRWLGYLALVLGIIHAIPFFVQRTKEEGMEGVRVMFASNIVYWNGVASLVLLAWLCGASIPWFRRLAYEFFAYTHMVVGIAFIGCMIWHCANMLSSWSYLFAALGIWGACGLYRIFVKTNLVRGGILKGDRATFSKLSDDGVKITIPTKMKWKPGQHVFIRVPGISWTDNHPFTIASVMKAENLVAKTDRHSSGRATPEEESYNDVVIVFKPFKGFTRKAFELSRKFPDLTLECFLDGPYGGLPRPLEAFDTVLLIAGGSGITPVVAHLQDLCRKMKTGAALTRDVRIVWTVKRFQSLEWFKDEIAAASRMLPPGTVHVQYFITQEVAVQLPEGPVSATRQWPGEVKFPTEPPSPYANSPDAPYARPPRSPPPAYPPPVHTLPTVEEEAAQRLSIYTCATAPSRPVSYVFNRHDVKSSHLSLPPLDTRQSISPVPNFGDDVMIEFGRPLLRTGLRPWAQSFGKRTCVYVCGPEAMKVDVTNAVAGLQRDVWAVEGREEVFLHTETFGY